MFFETIAPTQGNLIMDDSGTPSPRSSNQSDNAPPSQPEDSPAFRLRPKRSTPRKPDNRASGSNTSAVGSTTDRHLSALMIVKRNLFTKNKYPPFEASSGDENGNARPRRDSFRRKAAESVVTDCSIGPFMESITLEELRPDAVYDRNYITLIVDHIISDNQVKLSDDCNNDSPTSSVRCRTIMTDEGIAIQLYGEYCRCPVERGKLIHVAKFKTSGIQKEASVTNGNHHGATENTRTVPFHIIVQAINDSASPGDNQSTNFVPLVSVTDTLDEPEDPYVELLPVDHQMA